MPKKDFDHHEPREHDKKRHHKRGFSEEVQDARQARLSFKNYLRELEEQMLEDEAVNGAPLTDEDTQFIIKDFKEWSGGVLPEECGDDQLQSYAYEALPQGMDEQEVLSFLRNYSGE